MKKKKKTSFRDEVVGAEIFSDSLLTGEFQVIYVVCWADNCVGN